MAFFRPKSPWEKMSSRPRENMRNISAVQRPMPFTVMSAAMTSSSDKVERVDRGDWGDKANWLRFLT